MRVLAGFAESLCAIEACWSLLEAGHEVTVVTRRGRRPPLRLEPRVRLVAVHPPEQDAARCLADLREAARDAAAVVPFDDVALWLALRLEGPVLAGPPRALEALALDKRVQLERAAAAGLAVPPPGHDVVKPALAAGPLPGGRGAGKPAEPVLRQRRLRGTSEGLFGLATARGIRAWSAHRRLRTLDPAGSGASACVSIPVDPALRAPVARLLEGWRGPFMVELLRDADGTAWFIELNGRLWGSLALARRRGLEYPAWAVAHALDPAAVPPEPAADPPPARARHLGRDLRHLAAVLRGPTRATDRGVAWPSRAGAVRAVLVPRRGERLYNHRPGRTRLWLDDTWRTVRG